MITITTTLLQWNKTSTSYTSLVLVTLLGYFHACNPPGELHRALLYGLGYPRQPFPGDNFIERLYVKT